MNTSIKHAGRLSEIDSWKELAGSKERVAECIKVLKNARHVRKNEDSRDIQGPTSELRTKPLDAPLQDGEPCFLHQRGRSCVCKSFHTVTLAYVFGGPFRWLSTPTDHTKK